MRGEDPPTGLQPMNRKSNRREFLRGKAAVDAVADLVQESISGDGSGPWPAEPAGECRLIRLSRRAMACQFEVLLGVGQYEGGTEAALEALDLVEALEEQLSVFRPTSEISRLNRTCADGPVEVEPRLFELLEWAIRLHAETGGAFDVTSGPLWRLWGFARRAGRIPNEDALGRVMQSVGSHLIELDRQETTVRFLRPGVEMNLGSIGKGYALDRCAEVLLGAGIEGFLVHGGQSSVLGRGSPEPAPSRASQNNPPGWVVGIRHPVRREERLGELRLRDRALATSGSGSQFFRSQGRRYGHVLDPRTGQPAQGLLSATVVAPTAVKADALSTALFAMGPEKAIEYCQSKPDLGAVLVCPSDRGPGFEVRSTGLDQEELRLLDPR